MNRLTCAVCRKTGTKAYGSDGTTVALDIEIDNATANSAQALAETIRRLQALCEVAVNEEITKLQANPFPSWLDQATKDQLAAAQAAAPARRPAAAPPAAAPAPGPARRPAPAPPAAEQFDEYEEDDQADDDDTPSNGSQLLGWARKQEPDLKNFIISLGKKMKFAGRVVEWNQAQVNQAYAAAKQSQRKQR